VSGAGAENGGAGQVGETARPGEAAADRALMGRVQQGEEPALAALMERWERPVKALIARIVLNAGEAEELAQEAFVRVWQQREKFRPEAEFRPWLFAIAVNLARNRLRWWRRRPVVSLDAWSEGGEGRGPWAEGRVAGGASPAQNEGAARLERAERATAVREAIAALPLELREALVLFEYERMSHAEIATTVGTTPKAIETRLYRAREKLRGTLRRWV
jgi:RNA polymerase sigma-70 factor (ECF subfamily)